MESENSENEDIPLVIRFVLPKGKTETTCSEDLGCAFDQAQDLHLNPNWIDEEDCKALTPAKTVLLCWLLKFAETRSF